MRQYFARYLFRVTTSDRPLIRNNTHCSFCQNRKQAKNDNFVNCFHNKSSHSTYDEWQDICVVMAFGTRKTQSKFKRGKCTHNREPMRFATVSCHCPSEWPHCKPTMKFQLWKIKWVGLIGRQVSLTQRHQMMRLSSVSLETHNCKFCAKINYNWCSDARRPTRMSHICLYL